MDQRPPPHQRPPPGTVPAPLPRQRPTNGPASRPLPTPSGSRPLPALGRGRGVPPGRGRPLPSVGVPPSQNIPPQPTAAPPHPPNTAHPPTGRPPVNMPPKPGRPAPVRGRGSARGGAVSRPLPTAVVPPQPASNAEVPAEPRQESPAIEDRQQLYSSEQCDEVKPEDNTDDSDTTTSSSSSSSSCSSERSDGEDEDVGMYDNVSCDGGDDQNAEPQTPQSGDAQSATPPAPPEIPVTPPLQQNDFSPPPLPPEDILPPPLPAEDKSLPQPPLPAEDVSLPPPPLPEEDVVIPPPPVPSEPTPENNTPPPAVPTEPPEQSPTSNHPRTAPQQRHKIQVSLPAPPVVPDNEMDMYGEARMSAAPPPIAPVPTFIARKVMPQPSGARRNDGDSSAPPVAPTTTAPANARKPSFIQANLAHTQGNVGDQPQRPSRFFLGGNRLQMGQKGTAQTAPKRAPPVAAPEPTPEERHVPAVAELPQAKEGVFVDTVSDKILQQAVHMHEAYQTVLESLHLDFEERLKAEQGASFEKEINLLFRDLGLVTEAVKGMLATLRGALAQATGASVADLVVKQRGYVSALKAYTASLSEGFAMLHTLNGVEGFRDTLGKCFMAGTTDVTIEDLIVYAAAFPQQLFSLCTSQIAYRSALERTHHVLRQSCTYSQPFFRSQPTVSPLTEMTSISTDTLTPLSDIAKRSQEITTWAAGVTEARRITVPPGLVVPPGIGARTGSHDQPPQQRKFIDCIKGRLRVNQAYGLCRSSNASLLLFSDCVALCTTGRDENIKETEYLHPHYTLVACYMKESLWYKSDVQQRTVTLAIHEPWPPESEAPKLPPGWEEEAGGSRKREHVYLYEHNGIRQTTSPTHMGRLRERHTFTMSSAELLCTCTQRLKELTGSADKAEIPEPVHKMIGVELNDLVSFEKANNPDRLEVPQLCTWVVPYLVAHGQGEKGIFRVAAEKRHLDEICHMLHSEGISGVNLDEYSINSASGLLKMFLRDMPSPLLTTELYKDFINIGSAQPEDKPELLSELVSRLPQYNKEVLRVLLSLLHNVQCNKHINAMDEKNLGIVTAPNILRLPNITDVSEMNTANEVVASMVAGYETIFIKNNANPRGTNGEWARLKRKLLGNDGGIRAAVYDHDRNTVLAIDGHLTLALFDAKECLFIKTGSLQDKTNSRTPEAAVYARGRFWIAYTNTLVICDAESLEVVHVAQIPARRLLTVGDNTVWVAGDKAINILNAETFKVESTISDHAASLYAMACIGNEVWAACKGDPLVSIHIWDARTLTYNSSFLIDTKDVFDMCVYNNTLWVAAENPAISIWDITTKSRIHKISAVSVAFTVCPLRDQVWFGSTKAIFIVDPRDFEIVGEIRGYHDNITSTLLTVQDDKGRLNMWSGSYDKSVCVWNVDNLPE